MPDIKDKSCFLDTSFIINALLYSNTKASSFLMEIITKQAKVYINLVVLSELLHALERIYFKQYCSEIPISSVNNKEFKKWRKQGLKYYDSVINEYRTIIDTLEKSHEVGIINLTTGTGPLDIILKEKIKFPPLDANDCIHYISVKNKLNNIDFIVTCDYDFNSINTDKSKKVQVLVI